jgi:gamma-glutamyl:cysteine ligase YbdK (ATP-grasp superfamily)
MSGDMTAAEQQRHAEVRQRVRQLYAAIENLLKRHGIHQFLITATTILRESFGDASMMTK